MVFVDSGFIVALCQGSDGLHARAGRWADHIEERLLITEYVLLESINALSKQAVRRKAHQVIDSFVNNPDCLIISASLELFKAGLKIHREREDKNWSLTDCISFLVMGEHGLTRALAHDVHFEQAGFVALLRGEPPI